MYYDSWTQPYVPHNPSGVTSGTIDVPAWNDADWNLINSGVNSVVYRASSATGTASATAGSELTVKTQFNNAPYAAMSQMARVSGSMRIPGLTSRQAYVKLVSNGVAADSSGTLTDAVAPMTFQISCTLPDGVEISIDQIRNQAGIALSALTNELMSGKTDPLSRIPTIIAGGVRIAG